MLLAPMECFENGGAKLLIGSDGRHRDHTRAEGVKSPLIALPPAIPEGCDDDCFAIAGYPAVGGALISAVRYAPA